MKALFLSLAACFFTSIGFSQNCVDTFYRKGYYGAGMVLHASENIITRDGATVIAGRYTNTGNGEIALFVTKINPLGTVVWSKKIMKGSDNTDFQFIDGIKELNNGNFVIVYRDAGDNSGSTINIIQLSAAGNLLWAKELTTVAVDDFFLNAQITVTDNNDIIIAATIVVEEWAHAGETVPLIIKMDNSGNILYNRWFAGNTCSASTLTGVITDKNMLYAFGRSGGCPIPGNAEIDENIFAFKMDHQTGELLLSRSYFSTRTLAYPIVTLMYNKVFADMVKSSEDHFYISDRFYSFAQNRFGLINTVMDTLLNFSGGRLFSNDQISVNTVRFGTTDPSGNWSIYTVPGENNNTMYIATISKSGQIIRQRKMPFSANEVVSYGGKYPLHYNHQYLNIVSNYLRNGNSYLQLYQTGQDNEADPCFGVDTSFVQLEPFPITPHNDDYFTYSSSIRLAESDPGISVSDINLIEEDYCRQISRCSFLKIKPAVTTICDTGQTYIFTARKDAGCLKQVLWQTDSAAVSAITPLNDSSVAITFKKQWQGYLYASLSSCIDLKDSIKLNVLISPGKIALGADTAICKNDSLVLRAGAGFKAYQWQNGSGDSVFTVKQAGMYFVKATNYCGDPFDDAITVTINEPLPVDLGKDTAICSNQPLTLDAGAGFSSYQWNNGETGQYIQADRAGTYSVSAANASGCLSKDTVQIRAVYSAPVVTLPHKTTLCLNQDDTLHAGNGFSSYLWQDGSTGSSMLIQTPGKYKVTVSNPYGCIASDSVTITKIAQAPAGFLPADTIICATDPFTIQPLKLFNEYLWSTDASANSITVQTPGIYRLQVTDNGGCIGRDSISIFTKDCSTRFFVPNTFTPNNDGINDSFKPLISGRISDYEFTVYNIYGQIVFSSRRINEGWNGMYRNLPQNAGTYIWICRYKTVNEAAQFTKGSVVLMR
ncbi:gliding motility-associated C-terminal domain-containing protein [Agriterribacter sp.]|uniref:gliding motility-associated C-terminal domain-containing protein n=1 Tax=Agriterribacter sp. TaxID=2821509 RepID=UPI002BDA6290|nr:gliding motility-associated C-terminal domain-containing protein [Agriterribacter sp.]HRP56122.1 gliding motility-associated C-terminal domain-containing protein [Agriterribacter sp.]